MKQSRQLILRTTSRCNFNCDYCSASNLQSDELSVDSVKQYIDKYSPLYSIVFEGGDPLMKSPQWFIDVIDYAEKVNPNIEVLITSNLWDFYKRPQKWIKVLNDRIDAVTTSFDYTDQRKIGKKVYDKDMFIDVVTKFKQLVPDTPLTVISVISEKNEDKIDELVQLFESLDIEYKFNPLVSSGRSGKDYPISSMFKIWIDCVLKGYKEQHGQILIDYIKKGYDLVGCPFSTKCDQWQITVNPDNSSSTCSIIASSLKNDRDKNTIWLQPINRERSVIDPIDCPSCPCFQICNNCAINTNVIKKVDLESHCKSMLETYKKAKESTVNYHDAKASVASYAEQGSENIRHLIFLPNSHIS